MKLKNIFILVILINIILDAQSIQVDEQIKLKIDKFDQAYYPQFSKDDSKIIFSSSTYRGLYTYDIWNESSSVITDELGAGYNPLVMDNATILYRSFKLSNGKKYHSLKSFDLNTGNSKIFKSDKRSLKLPKQTNNNEVVLIENSEVKREKIDQVILRKASLPSKAVYVEDNNLILVENNEQKIINPLGKGVYVWESFSNDGTKILFSFGNKGTFVSDLEGNIILNIEDARYPKFSPNDKFISYMNDKDNGYNYISSDIFIYAIETGQTIKVTDTADKIEMFAEWSNDGSKLVYNTTEGEIYITELKIEN